MTSPFVFPYANCPAYTGQFAVYSQPYHYYSAARAPSVPSPHLPGPPKPDRISIQKQSTPSFKNRIQSGIEQTRKGAIWNIIFPLISVYDKLLPAFGKLITLDRVPAGRWKKIAREVTAESMAITAATFSIGAFKPIPEREPRTRTESGLNAMRTLLPGIISGGGTLTLLLGLTDPKRKKQLIPYFQEQLRKCGHWFIPLSVLMGAAVSGGAFCWGAYRFGKPLKQEEGTPILEQIHHYAPLISGGIFALGGWSLLNFMDKPSPLKSKILKLFR